MPARAEGYRKEARRLTDVLASAWDGEWYRRGYYDDGTPLGSAQNDECRIDSISQSWAVLSGAVPPKFADRAMDGVRTFLLSRGASVLQLLSPPFDTSAQDPGYIKGYPPGIRENGGQYTHAAAWIVMALARLGSGDEAAEVFHMLNPVNHTRDAAGLAELSNRAVRHRRRRLQPPRAPRAWRMELVHGIGGLVVPGRCRKHARPAPGRIDVHASIHASRPDGRHIRSHGDFWRRPTTSACQIPIAAAEGCAVQRSMGSRWTTGPSRWSMTAGRTKWRSRSAFLRRREASNLSRPLEEFPRRQRKYHASSRQLAERGHGPRSS